MSPSRINLANAERLSTADLRRCRPGTMRTFIIPEIVLSARLHDGGQWCLVSRAIRADVLDGLPSIVCNSASAVR